MERFHKWLENYPLFSVYTAVIVTLIFVFQIYRHVEGR